MKVESIITAGPIRAALFVSIVTTVRNEARNIAALLDSLVVQEPPIEVIVVDSHSEDATRDIVRNYEKRYDFVHLYVFGGTRGTGRNFGIGKAKGEAIAFIDGDAIANPFWIRELRAGHPISFRADAIVYHRTRDSMFDFLRQALWNGAGRKQLTLKHGVLWSRYRPGRMLRQKTTFWSLLRLSVALLGYVGYKFFGEPLPASARNPYAT